MFALIVKTRAYISGHGLGDDGSGLALCVMQGTHGSNIIIYVSLTRCGLWEESGRALP